MNFIDGKRTYRVVIDDISSSIETIDSFAIKFSLLTRSPLARMKHVVRRLPAKVWEGADRSRAERVLALIEEAGGKGRIVETAVAPSKAPEEPETIPKPIKETPVARSCAMCGFPMKEEETRCGFCMTPAGAAGRVDPPPGAEFRASIVSRRRLLIYAACAAACAAIIWMFLR